MDKKLLHLLTIDDLDGENRELAELVGMEAFIKLVEVYGGTGKLYVPQADKVLIPVRDEKIREEYNGTNLYGICKKWELSESTVRAIVRDKALTLRREREEKKRAPPDGQISMYDL